MKPSYTEELDLNLKSPEFALDIHIMTITQLFNTMSEKDHTFSFFKQYEFNICKDTDLEEMMENTEHVFGPHKLESRILHQKPDDDDITISDADHEQIRKNIEELYNIIFESGCEYCGIQRQERMMYADYFILNKCIHPDLKTKYPILLEEEIRNIFMRHLWTFVNVNRENMSIKGKLIDTYVNDELILEPQQLEQKTLRYMEFATGLLEKIDFDTYGLVDVEYPCNVEMNYSTNCRYRRTFEYKCVYFYKWDAAYCVYILPEDEDVITFLQSFQKSRFKDPERYGYIVVSRELYDRIRVYIYRGCLAFAGSYQVGVVVTIANKSGSYKYTKRPVSNRIENNGFNTIKPKEQLIPIDGIDEENEYWRLCCDPVVIERTFKIRKHCPVEMLKMREVQVVAKYVSSMIDLVNINKTTKDYRGLIESFHYNPVPLRTSKEYKAFNDAHSGREWRYHHYDDVNLTLTPDEIVRYYIALEDIWDDLNKAVKYRQLKERSAILHAARENSD